MKSFKIVIVFLLLFGIQNQAYAYYPYSRTANQEINQVTDLDGNPISGFDVNYSSNTYNNYNYNYNYNYTSITGNQCYDSYNHTYYNCGNTSTSAMKLVYIQNNAITTPTITIRKGSYVKWVNRDNAGHRIIGDSTSYKIDSGTLYLNYTYSKAFSTIGTFRYHDPNNSNIKGKVIVTN